MLAAQGIIPQEDADAIAQGLEGILADLKSGALVFDPGAEDVYKRQAFGLCDNIAVMRDGGLALSGSAAELSRGAVQEAIGAAAQLSLIHIST